jgi:hypothetical protein
MRSTFFILTLLAVVAVAIQPAKADRPTQKRDKADYVVSGTVNAVYARDTKGYKQYIVEIRVEQVDKGARLKKGDIFRAFCYQRKEGFGGMEFDTSGHKAVPKEGQQIKAFVNSGSGYNEGVYPDWFDVIGEAGK